MRGALWLTFLLFQDEKHGVNIGSNGTNQNASPSVAGLQDGMADISLDETDAVPPVNRQMHRVVVTSTVSGDPAWLHSGLGSPFIRAIVVVFNHFAHFMHFEDMILKVTDVMAKWGRNHGVKQICEKRSATLSKTSFFALNILSE
ncbi:hypothetical protein CAPTEDRAFT_191588, partial [Capitella teleta]